MVMNDSDMDMNRKYTIALLPPFKYYLSLSVNADVFAVRFPCQIDSEIRNNLNLVLFDEYINKELAQRYNQKAVYESLHHSMGENGDVSFYKGVSLVDIDHAAIYCSVFLHCYREALAFLTLVERFNPRKIIIEIGDPNIDIFSELAGQLNIEVDKVNSLGITDKEKQKLIKNSNRGLDIQNYHWYRWLKQPVWKLLLIRMQNCWSGLIRKIKGDRPFVYIIHHGQLSGIRLELSQRKEYYPVFFSLIRLPLISLLGSGLYILQKRGVFSENKEIAGVIIKYRAHLKNTEGKKLYGQIELHGVDYSIVGSIIKRLNKHIPDAFRQIACNVDIIDNFINKNKVSGALLSSDLNWDRRIVIKIFQKYKRENMTFINGWFGTKHMIENKTVDKVLCFGESYLTNYFKDKKEVKSVGSPVFDAAYKMRAMVRPKYPIEKVLISTFTFSPDDINCHYSDSEKYISDLLRVIKSYDRRVQIALRPHPSDSPDFYRWYLERQGFYDIKLELTGDFHSIVSKYDLFVGSYSTTIFEAASMGIPVLFYHPSNQILHPPFDGQCSELPSAFCNKELQSVFLKMNKDKEFAYRFTDVNVLRPYVGDLDGGSTSRIVEEAAKMAVNYN